VLFTQDDDLLAEAARRQENRERFAGLVYETSLTLRLVNVSPIWSLLRGRRIRKSGRTWSLSAAPVMRPASETLPDREIGALRAA
jgi:hypothetical protein